MDFDSRHRHRRRLRIHTPRTVFIIDIARQYNSWPSAGKALHGAGAPFRELTLHIPYNIMHTALQRKCERRKNNISTSTVHDAKRVKTETLTEIVFGAHHRYTYAGRTVYVVPRQYA